MGPLYSFGPVRGDGPPGRGVRRGERPHGRVCCLCAGSRCKARVHVKIDSGMNRQGLFPDQVDAFLESIRGIPEIELAGVMTHFACVAEDPSSIDRQLERFLPAVERVRRRVAPRHRPRRQQRGHRLRPPLPSRHGALRLRRLRARPLAGRRAGRGSAARPHLEVAGGAGQAGATRRRASATATPSCRAAPPTWLWSPSAMATGCSGRSATAGEVLINGRRYPMVGRISMDSFGVDVGTDGRVKVGDTVTLIGADGDERITVEEVAQPPRHHQLRDHVRHRARPQRAALPERRLSASGGRTAARRAAR